MNPDYTRGFNWAVNQLKQKQRTPLQLKELCKSETFFNQGARHAVFLLEDLC
jgi:hypothetical protein